MNRQWATNIKLKTKNSRKNSWEMTCTKKYYCKSDVGQISQGGCGDKMVDKIMI